MPGQIRGVIFDLDGTLIDSIHYHFTAFKNMLGDYGFKMPGARMKKLVGLSTLDILKKLDHVKKSGLRLADLREERHYYYFKLIGERNLEFPGVIHAIKKLGKLGYKVAIATGSSNIVYFHSTSKKFRGLFRVVVTIDDVSNGKPAPDCFLLAAARLGLRPDECLAVGDSKYDLLAAKAAGMKFCGVLGGAGTKKELGKTTVSGVKQLPQLLRKNAWNK